MKFGIQTQIELLALVSIKRKQMLNCSNVFSVHKCIYLIFWIKSNAK